MFKLLTLLLFIISLIKSHLPVVLWHGMGDTANGMNDVAETIKDALGEDSYVYAIQIGQNMDEDRNFGFLDKIERQVLEVCKKLKSDGKLSHGFNAVGFSQGGLFMRAYVQACNDPPVHNLVTFGSPHAGVAEIPKNIPTPVRFVLNAGVYLPYVQNRIVQAQYFKDPHQIEKYLEFNIFLPIYNQELTANMLYSTNMKVLKNFVMIQFEEDNMIVPKESAWFGFVDEDGNTISFKEQSFYFNDTLGLKTLDKKKRLAFETWPGQHMQISLEKFRAEIVEKYFINDLDTDTYFDDL
ncbi:hypothetical protein HK099_006972 [Clydaea vesicula]|uniref:Palmitoyl-protein thioesterase 1 n=1 Tax=Clydaea vesicula TaxID=447962 RepID=A0AAD5U9P7_9FUNG|nr:hypothetical protein HK099_006972 [Clydaea vesicula]